MRLTAEDVRILGLETAHVAGHTLKVTALPPEADPITLAELRDHVAGPARPHPRSQGPAGAGRGRAGVGPVRGVRPRGARPRASADHDVGGRRRRAHGGAPGPRAPALDRRPRRRARDRAEGPPRDGGRDGGPADRDGAAVGGRRSADGSVAGGRARADASPRPRRHPPTVGGHRARARAGGPPLVACPARRVLAGRGVRLRGSRRDRGAARRVRHAPDRQRRRARRDRRRPASLAAGAGRTAAPDAREGPGEPASLGRARRRARQRRLVLLRRPPAGRARTGRPAARGRTRVHAAQGASRRAGARHDPPHRRLGRGALVDEPARVHAQRLQRPRPARRRHGARPARRRGLRARGGRRLARPEGRRLLGGRGADVRPVRRSRRASSGSRCSPAGSRRSWARSPSLRRRLDEPRSASAAGRIAVRTARRGRTQGRCDHQ